MYHSDAISKCSRIKCKASVFRDRDKLSVVVLPPWSLLGFNWSTPVLRCYHTPSSSTLKWTLRQQRYLYLCTPPETHPSNRVWRAAWRSLLFQNSSAAIEDFFCDINRHHTRAFCLGHLRRELGAHGNPAAYSNGWIRCELMLPV